MKKYIRALICWIIGLLKFGIIKLIHRKKFLCGFINLISPRTEVTLDKGGNLKIGEYFKMRSGAKLRVRKTGSVFIGKNFSMSNNCVITSWESIEIGENVQFGPGVLVYDQDHDYAVVGGLKAEKYKTSPIKIGNGVWIGANSIILRGTKIGDNSVVAAGSVIKGVYGSNLVIYNKREINIKTIVKKK